MMAGNLEEQAGDDLADQVDQALELLWRGESGGMERLLDADESDAPGLGAVLGGLWEASAQAELTADEPREIGGYSIRRVLGRGGMGTVYLAVQERPRRTVALKVMKSRIASRSALRRFEYESQVLARLQHPNIAQVYEAGTHEEGQVSTPWFAMEYIPNARPITEYAERVRLSIPDRARLFAAVCDAVHHGHQKGVIHRDLKPGNILINARGEPKIIDFGVARSTDSDMAVTTLQTDLGQLVGTLQYMSPEQCEADPHNLDVRSDVYALGVVLYELLTERLPYVVTKVAVYEALKLIREETPARPSTLNRTLRGDLETIALKALEKDRERRYRSAAELGDDIKRYLRNAPIEARPPSTLYQLKMFARRNRVVVGAGATVMAALAVATIVSLLFALSANRARRTAELEAGQRLLAEREALAARDEEARQRRAAEGARQEAQENLALAELRENEAAEARDQLATVVEFQQSMLGEVDAEQMGRSIVADLRERVRRSLMDGGTAPEAVASSMATLDQLCNEINATDLALRVIDEEVMLRATGTIAERFADQPLVEAALRQTIGDTYKRLGLFSQALPQMESALRMRREQLGGEHAETLESVRRLGLLFHEMGEYEPAERYLREALACRRRVFGANHRSSILAVNDMALLLSSMGRYPEAETFRREALEDARRVLGRDDPQTLDSISNMGALLFKMGRYAEAEACHREALEGRRRVLGEDHADTLVAISNLGTLYCATGAFEKAEPLLRETLALRRRMLGDNHPATLGALNNMGAVMWWMNRLDEAEPYFREALERQRSTLGDDHPNTLGTMNNLGLLLVLLEKYEEGRPLFEEVLARRRRALGDDHPETIASVNNLGFFFEQSGDLELAEQHYRAALEARRRVLGDDHPDTLTTMHAVASVCFRRDTFRDAETLALEYWRRYQGGARSAQTGVVETIKLLIELYDAWHEVEPDVGYDAKAAEWRATLSSMDDEQGDG